MKSFQASAVLAVHLWVAMATSSMAMDSSNSSESDHNDNNSSSSSNTGDDDENGGSPTRSYDGYDGWRYHFFTVFRLGLFVFIIFFPLLRSIRVWYDAGGRIRFRRSGGVDAEGNGRGWIIGLRYVPPDLERWLILTGYAQTTGEAQGSNRQGMARLLTAEEVYALPEIDAPKRQPESNSSNENENNCGSNDGDGYVNRFMEIAMGTDDKDNNNRVGGDELAATYHGSGGNNRSAFSSGSDHASNNTTDGEAATRTTTDVEEASPPEPPAANTAPGAATTACVLHTTTMSTTCSICIDDFEENEKIRLLPRCGHAFHTECILPWLTERQGCCPTCKTEVLCPPNDKAENGNNGEADADANTGVGNPMSLDRSNNNDDDNNNNNTNIRNSNRVRPLLLGY
mmetsp:Transcript_5091/g.10680  ORF Transcript_5091/g.10680 Transcript_5091/m.10680 type:complete len:399 (+) Transcript_5091:484-1680(+)|eukprot:CAMPEP_0201137336 /NCGR_PEP_ID=MMETSP0850-20130426/55354_1 /ASSEMBLY_ACC=CAM_ASM_000622 /TAXON_ID=183588 /ORGANISM="Pseudo-nitzschia fraudulenta, Strain WWA7" /LENGTH=398 /DNA_ID=CAMNT_0047408681 /DNA_START=430 /DNA_END=1626 /DNA_ORIENTATION=-